MLEMCLREWKRTIRILTNKDIWAIIVAILASPWELWDKWQWHRLAVSPALMCACGEEVSLLGEWRCRCGYTYQGHLMRTCPVCLSMPRVARCYACGLTTKLPEA